MSAELQSWASGSPMEVVEAEVRFMEMPLAEPVPAKVRAYRKSELCELYGVSKPTLTQWINLFGPDFAAIGYQKHCKWLTPKMVELLFERVGRPY